MSIKESSAKDGVKTGEGNEVGLFIPLPSYLAKKYPSLGEKDKSPPHITFLYAGECPKDKISLFIKVCRDTLGYFNRPVIAILEPLDYFRHPDKDQSVAITPVRFDRDMGQLKELLKANLKEAGFEIQDSFPIYRPHVTLSYMEGLDSSYKGVVPTGSCLITEVEVWGLPKVYRISFLRGFEKKAAKYKRKIENGKDKPIYEYSDGHVKRRNEEKANRVDLIRSTRKKLSKKVRRDLSSPDPKTRVQALVLACIDRTYERIGNPVSAENGRFGVTGWQKKHVSFKGDTAEFKYVGKSGVRQEKIIKDPQIVSELKKLVKNIKPGDFVFSWKDDDGTSKVISAREINEYLKKFGITAKDLRGYHANREMVNRLSKKRSKPLPIDLKEKDKILKKEFKEALEETSSVVGHNPETLRNQYLVPGLEEKYTREGKVLHTFKKHKKTATKTQTEKEDEEVRRTVQKHPKIKPTRKDLKRRRLHVEKDEDLETEDRDLSLNYKKVAKNSQSFAYNPGIIFRKTLERSTGGVNVPYIKIANRRDGDYLSLDGRDTVGPFKKYSSALRVIAGYLGKDPTTVILGEKFSIGPNTSQDRLTKHSHCIMDVDGDVVVEGSNPVGLLSTYHQDFFRTASEKKSMPVRSFEEVTHLLDKVASLFENHHQYLGINRRIAHDYALRCDVLSDLIEKKANDGSQLEIFARLEEGETDEPYMDHFDDTPGPLVQEPDETYMSGEFTGQDTHELADIEKRAAFWEAIEAGPRSREHREFRKLAMNSTIPETSAERYWDRPSGALLSDADEPYMKENFTEQEWEELQKMEGTRGGKKFDQEMVNGEFRVDWK